MRILLAAMIFLGIVKIAPVHINNLSSAPVMETVQQVTEPTVANTPNETVAVVETPAPEIEQVQEVKQVVETPQPRKGCELAYNYDWPQDIAYAICMAESSGNQDAVNWSDNHGKCQGSFSLWQVGCFWYPFYGYSDSDYYNPEVNVQIAYNIYKRQGSFNAWTTFTRGSYLKYLK